MPEKLTACCDCKWVFEVDPWQYICQAPAVQCPQFDAFTANTVRSRVSPDCSKVNTNGHCPHFEAKQ
jgi:hypothetical protein